MNNMTDGAYVSGLKSNMHAVFDTPQGKEILKFLELTCCWYQPVFVPQDPQMTLINDGRRQVVATIKTILELNAEQIVALAKSKEE
jgi:hypothetical protein